ncbi:MAG: PIN domain-containing protein, partial [Edaphobacter sp.]
MKSKKAGSHLFIDTNVLLGFYAFTNDDLKELEKLVNILKTKVVKLYITQQVVDEFYRNRDSKLNVSFDVFRPSGNESCPSFMTSLPEYAAFKKALESYKNSRKELREKARVMADDRDLLADKLFARIVEQADVIHVSDVAYAAADRRARLGNPPGKAPSTIGDELNWELLLA